MKDEWKMRERLIASSGNSKTKPFFSFFYSSLQQNFLWGLVKKKSVFVV